MKKLQKKIEKGPMGGQLAGIVTNPKGVAKMSDVLEDFVEPYLKFAKGRAQQENVFGIGVAAWNIAILPEDERQPMIDRIIQEFFKGSNDLQTQKDMRETIDALIDRKHELFADNLRMIVSFQLEGSGSNYQLSVASTLTGMPTDTQS